MAIDLKPLWDYAKPELSEQRFRAALANASDDDRLVLQTQISRTQGLRRDFDKARETLAGVETKLSQASAEARVRFHLELGRSYCSPVHPPALRTPENVERARANVLRAHELAAEARLELQLYRAIGDEEHAQHYGLKLKAAPPLKAP